MADADPRKLDPKVEEELDRLDRSLKLSAAEVQRRMARDYAGELLKLCKWEPFELPAPGEITLDVGITGTGKSTWTKAMLARWPKARVLVWDYLDEYSILGRQTDHVMLGPLTQRVTMSELRERPEMLDAPELRLAVVPDRRGAKGRGEDFVDFIDLQELDDKERGTEEEEARGSLPYLLVVEEIGRVAPYAVGECETLATIGRHDGVALMAVAQWANAIPHPIRRQCRRIVAHAQTWDLDLDALRQPMRKQPELVERISELPNHQRVIWDRDAAHRGSTAAA